MTDPHIRQFHQARNLMELFGALAIIKDPADEVSVKLFTGETTDGAENSRSRWGSCCGSSKGAAVAGINLDVRFDASIHDRSIVANSDWHMHLGRGLDIFQFVPN